MDLRDYKLVWSEEFDENSFEETKFTLQKHGPIQDRQGNKICYFTEEERVIKVEDSKLVLNAVFDQEKDAFVVPAAVWTKDTMSFTYGYVEMKARVPYGQGSWAAFWALGRDAINQDKTQPYFAEIDIFEVEGACHIAEPNLHKWHYTREGNAPFYFMGPEDSPIRGNDQMQVECWERRPHEATRFGYHRPENPEDFNIYGFLWTPETMEMYINGHLYGRYIISEDFGRPSGMEPFHSPIYLIINEQLSLKDNYGMCQARPENAATPESVKKLVPYEIDYIRLYQKEGEGELNVRTKD